jgi:hypothetical protein
MGNQTSSTSSNSLNSSKDDFSNFLETSPELTSNSINLHIQEILEKTSLLIKPMIHTYGKSNLQIYQTIPTHRLTAIPGKDGKTGGDVEWSIFEKDMIEHLNIQLRYIVFVIKDDELLIYGKDDFSGMITMTYRGKLVKEETEKIKACTHLLGFEYMRQYQKIYSSGLDFEMSTECFMKPNGEWTMVSRPSPHSMMNGWTGILQEWKGIL